MDNYRELKIRCDSGFGHLLLDDAIELGSVQKRNQLSEYIFVYVHNSLFKFGCKDTNSNPFAQFSTYNNLNFKIFKELFWSV